MRLDLNRIPDDRLWGVICNTEQELRAFIDAVKIQRSDIDIGSLGNPSRLSDGQYHGKAYFLNYRDSKCLQMGTPRNLRDGLYTMGFQELVCAPELPDINIDQLEVLSMLGF